MIISEDDFNEWKENIVTIQLFKYLEDLCKRDVQYLAEDFMAGALHLADKESMALNEGKAIARAEIVEITYEEIEEFYNAKQEEREPDQAEEA